MKSPEIVVVSAIAALLLAGGVNFARGKQDVVVEGVAVQQISFMTSIRMLRIVQRKALLIFYSQTPGSRTLWVKPRTPTISIGYFTARGS